MPAALRVLTPPAVPVVDLATATGFIRAVPGTDDALITALLLSAAADAGAECGRGFGVATYLATFDTFPAPAPLTGGPLWAPAAPGYLPGWYDPHLAVASGPPGGLVLPVRPVLSVAAVTYQDATDTTQVMDPSLYWVAANGGRVAVKSGQWPGTAPGRPESVGVQFTAGHAAADLPPQAWQAILLILADRYQNRGDGDADRRGVPEAARRLLWQLHPGDVC